MMAETQKKKRPEGPTREQSGLELVAQRKSNPPTTLSHGTVAESPRSLRHRPKLGVFKGVFVPTLQNILGIILFVRVPLITGYAGIGEALVIVWLSSAATLLTSVSMSAVATNGVPQGGGAYSIIKNSLGPQFGGVTGILLCLSNVFGVAMYVLGAVEVLRESYAGAFGDVNERLLGTLILLGLAVVVFVGIKYIARFAVVFLSGVCAAVVSIWLGVVYHAAADVDKPNSGVSGFSAGNLKNNFGPRYCNGWTFARLLAVFFPAVTDPLAGSNLSGDLADPQDSIPKGTLAAMAVTIVVFTIQVVFVAGASGTRGHCGENDKGGLRSDAGGAFVIALGWPVSQVVEVGILVSTLGAGLQSLAGAPRLLAAIGRDKLLPALAVFAPAREDAEPRRAVVLCAFLSCCCVMLNDLDAVAPFITLWFLTCYGIINGAAAWLAFEQAPNFRPTFRYFDWRLSLLGVLLCVFIMFLTEPLLAAAAIAVACMLYKYIETQPGSRDITGVYDTELAELVAGSSEGTGFISPSPTDSADAHGASSSSSHRRENTAVASPSQSPRAVAQAFFPSRSASPGATGPNATTPKKMPADWRAGVRFRQARKAMLALEDGDLRFKYWRPFVLFLCKLDEHHNYQPQHGMINFVAQLMHAGRGLALVNGVLVAPDGLNPALAAEANRARRRLAATLRDRKVEGFADVVVAPSVVGGNRLLLQAKGMGFFRPNAVALGWPSLANSSTRDDPDGFCSVVEDAHALGKTVLLCKGTTDFPDGRRSEACFDRDSRIDVWWIFELLPANGLLLLLPYLLQKSRTWRRTKLRLCVVSEDAEEDLELDKAIRAMLKAGGVIADLLLLQVAIADAPRYASRAVNSPTSLRNFGSGFDGDDPAPFGSARDPPTRVHFDAALPSNPSKPTDDDDDAVPLKHHTDRPSSASPTFDRPVHRRQPSKLEWDNSVTQPSKLSSLVTRHSATAELVVMTLPDRVQDQTAANWIRSVDTLVADLKRVIFVRETGHENIQFFN